MRKSSRRVSIRVARVLREARAVVSCWAKAGEEVSHIGGCIKGLTSAVKALDRKARSKKCPRR